MQVEHSSSRASDEVHLYCFPHEWVPQWWPIAKPLIYKACVESYSDFEQLEKDLFNRHACLWMAFQYDKPIAAAITQVSRVNGELYCYLTVGGEEGKIKKWFGLLRIFEDYAKQERCKSFLIFGRLGWSKLLPSYKPKLIVLEKEIT